MMEAAVSPHQRFQFLEKRRDITIAGAAILVPLSTMSLIPPKKHVQQKSYQNSLVLGDVK
jgi:hypothetical protein